MWLFPKTYYIHNKILRDIFLYFYSRSALTSPPASLEMMSPGGAFSLTSFRFLILGQITEKK